MMLRECGPCTGRAACLWLHLRGAHSAGHVPNKAHMPPVRQHCTAIRVRLRPSVIHKAPDLCTCLLCARPAIRTRRCRRVLHRESAAQVLVYRRPSMTHANITPYTMRHVTALASTLRRLVADRPHQIAPSAPALFARPSSIASASGGASALVASPNPMGGWLV